MPNLINAKLLEFIAKGAVSIFKYPKICKDLSMFYILFQIFTSTTKNIYIPIVLTNSMEKLLILVQLKGSVSQLSSIGTSHLKKAGVELL